MKFAIFFLSLALTSVASAASFWTSATKVDEASLFYLGGRYYLSAKFTGSITKEDGSPIPNCSKTIDHNLVGNSSSTIPNNTYMPQLLALLLNAHNLGSEVSLYLTSGCNSVVGLYINGVKALSN